MNPHGLPEKALDSLKAVFGRHQKIKKVLLYGSRALGTHKPHSDIDLAIEAPDLSLTEFLKIKTELDELMLPYQVDLLLLHATENQNLVERVRQTGVHFL